MKEHPILFSGEMIRAILDGRKTQTRRVIKPMPYAWAVAKRAGMRRGSGKDSDNVYAIFPEDVAKSPYGGPGHRLWVRETHIIATQTDPPTGEKDVWYRATPPAFLPAECYPWRPSIHMPRWASRILLEVTDVRVERVQEITEVNARSEGPTPNWIGDISIGCQGGPGWCPDSDGYLDTPMPKDDSEEGYYRTGRQAFRTLWDSINDKRGFGWDVNPWVWVVEFRRIGNGK